MHPISLIFLGLCAFLLGIWLVRALERRRLKSSSAFPSTASSTSIPSLPARTQSTTVVSAALQREVEQLLTQNRKIEAIKRVKEQTNWGLKEAKAYVEQSQSGPSAAALSPEIEAAARQLMAEKQTIAAIKLVRNHTGWDLKQTKDFVEKL